MQIGKYHSHSVGTQQETRGTCAGRKHRRLTAGAPARMTSINPPRCTLAKRRVCLLAGGKNKQAV